VRVEQKQENLKGPQPPDSKDAPKFGLKLVNESNEIERKELDICFVDLKSAQEFLVAVYKVADKSNVRDFFGSMKWDPSHFYHFTPRLVSPKIVSLRSAFGCFKCAFYPKMPQCLGYGSLNTCFCFEWYSQGGCICMANEKYDFKSIDNHIAQDQIAQLRDECSAW